LFHQQPLQCLLAHLTRLPFCLPACLPLSVCLAACLPASLQCEDAIMKNAFGKFVYCQKTCGRC
jgi:hypothetical protein